MQQFQDGQTITHNGLTYVRQGGQWRAQQAQSPVTYIEPNPNSPGARAAGIKEREINLKEREMDREERDGGGATQGYTDAGKLRDEFMGSQSVKDITAVLPSYSAALQTPDTPEGDMSLVYAFAKMMDPNSVVRESEFESAAGNDTIFGQTVARIKKEAFNGGRLRPEARQRLRAEMIRRFGEMQEAYNADRGRYWRLAERGGFDPLLVVEQNHVQPYADDFRGAAADMRQMGGGRRNPQTGVLANGNEGDALDLGPIIGGGQGPNESEADYQARVQAEYAKEGIAYDPATVDRMMGQTDAAGSFVRGAGDTALFGMVDEIRAGGQAIGGALSGDGSFVDLYNQNVANERAYQGQLADVRPISYHGGQIAGAVALPYGSGVRSVKGLAALGAGEGAAYGFGSGEGTVGSIAGAAVGAPLGAAGGAAIGAIAPKVTGKLSDLMRRTPDDLDRGVVEAGQRQNIPIRQPDARPSTRADFAGVEASETGNPIVSRALQDDKAAMQGRMEQVGGDGRPLDDYELGQTLQDSSKRYLAQSASQANALYTRAEQLAGDAVADTTNAVRAIDEQIAELSAEGARGNAGQINYLNDIKADLQNGGSIQLLRGLRRNMRGQLDERGLTSSGADRRVGIVLDALAEDINRTLPAEAQRAFSSADEFYRGRMQLKDQVLKRFVGNASDPISPEQAASRFNSFMRSKDFGRFKRMLDTLEPEERLDIAATVAERLGQNRNGDFGYGALVSNTEKMSDRALTAVFGKDGAAAIKDLQIIARAKRDTAGKLNNSRTGVVNNRMSLKDTVMAIAGGSLAGVPGAVAGVALRKISEKVGNRRMAKLLLNPDFTKWMRNAPPTSNAGAVKAYSNRLTAVAAKNPVIAGEIKALQSALTEAFAQSPGRAAAQQEQDGR